VVVYGEAKRKAQRLLDESPGGPYVITGDQEFDVGWVFFYDSRRHQETGNLYDALGGNAPILIDRETGQAHPTGTARPIEEYVDEYAEQKRRLREGWPDSLDTRFLVLLGLVRDGMGKRDARYLDLLISMQHEPREGRTVYEELAELERRGLVRRRPAREGGAGFKWETTAAGFDVASRGG
jgi:hypothetical protein